MIRLGAILASVLVFALTLYTVVALASPGSIDRPTAHKLLPGSRFVFNRETVDVDGTVADTWANGRAQVSVAGAPGMLVSITRDGVSVSPSPMDKTKPGAALDAVQAYRAAGRSVVKDAIAAGVPSADAERLFGGDLNPSNLKSLSGAGNLDGMGASHPAAGGSDIMQSWCVSTTSPSGHVQTTACDTQYLDKDNGGGDWYIADKQQASGKSDDTSVWFPDRLTQIIEKVGYSSGNGVVQWTPTSTQAQGSCSTVSYGITSSQTGFSYSQSSQICPDNNGPYGLDTNTTNTTFGTAWNGTEPSANWYEGTVGVDLVHSPGSACNCPTLYLTQAWRN